MKVVTNRDKKINMHGLQVRSLKDTRCFLSRNPHSPWRFLLYNISSGGIVIHLNFSPQLSYVLSAFSKVCKKPNFGHAQHYATAQLLTMSSYLELNPVEFPSISKVANLRTYTQLLTSFN